MGTLGDNKITSCRPSSRLVSSPAIVTDNESGMMRRMMRMVDNSDGRNGMPLPAQNVEINPSHPIIVGLHNLKETEPVLAKVLAEQVYDNCLVAAGLMDDSRTMLPRLNDLLLVAIKSASTDNSTATVAANVQKESIDEKELNIDDTDKVVEAEIVEPKETKTEDSSASEKKSDFIEENLTKEEAEKERIYPEPNSHPLEEFSDEELETFMNMSEKELEQELRKEESKEEGAYKFTKEALEDEVLKRRQEVIDSSDRIEKAKLGEIKGNWTKNTDLDSLIKEKEKEYLKAKERAEARKKKK